LSQREQRLQEEDVVPMRIVELTEAFRRKFFAQRSSHDAAAERVASRIVADVRRGGDAALFRWSSRLDGVRLTRSTLWISRTELRAAHKNVSRETLARD